METKEVITNTLSGAAAGLASTFLMTKFQVKMKKLEKNFTQDKKDKESQEQQKMQQEKSETPSTVKMADLGSCKVVGHEIADENKEKAGNLVHYGFGTFLGALYGALNTRKERSSFISGLAFGAAVWAIADNVLVPLLGLSKGPTKQTLKTQVYGLASHLVYGVTLKNGFKLHDRILH